MMILLASSSPRRRMILSDIFPRLEYTSPVVDESPLSDETPESHVLRIAALKAKAVQPGSTGEDTLIIAADTIVTIDGYILGKPDDYDHAVSMIKLLSNRTHEVITGICLIGIIEGERKIIQSSETTSVRFKKLCDADIHQYLNSIEYLDKAGSYAIQENGHLIISDISGSLTNVIGFPVRLFLRELIQNGLMNFFE